MLAFFFIGIYGGFINAGIGFVIILFLHYVHRLSLVRANATKVAVGLFLALGNGLGAWFSSRISVNKGDGYIKIFLVGMVLVMAVKLWFFT